MKLACVVLATIVFGVASVSQVLGGKPRRRKLQQYPECIKCSGGSACLQRELVCDFTRNCPNAADEAEGVCRHANFGSFNSVDVGQTLDIGAQDNAPVKVASTNTWFALFRFGSKPGTSIFLDFTEVSFSANTNVAGASYIATGSGLDPTDPAFQSGRISPTGSHTISNSHAFTTNSHLTWVLVSHPDGEKVDFVLHVTAVECAVGQSPCVGSPQCISEQDRCNNRVDCLQSNEDELNCPHDGSAQNAPSVSSSLSAPSAACFDCVSDDLGCVEHKWVCDGTPDCNNGEDEQNCPCEGFQCSDRKCIPLGFRCDNIPDCSDDELNCPA